MILNFYLRKIKPPSKMRECETRNLALVRASLKRRGVPHPEKRDYHEANQRLAKHIASEVRK